MINLAQFQAQLQRAIVDGDLQILSQIAPAPRAERETLLSVYQHAYIARLVEALAEEYEKLAAFLGDDQYNAMACAYIKAHPSQSPNMRWLGQWLPEFLRTNNPYRETLTLAELATLERALNDAFDGEDASRLQLSELARVAADDWPALTFEAHPTVQRFNHVTNACDIWRALHSERTPPEPNERNEISNLIAYRSEFTANFRQMSSIEASLWDVAATGAHFADICEHAEALEDTGEPAQLVAGFLKAWIDAGLIAGVSLSTDRPVTTF